MSHPLQHAIQNVDVSIVRKCDSCGYLLFGDGENCNHCGTAVASTSAPAPSSAPVARSNSGVPVAARVPAPEVRLPVALPVAPPPPRTLDAPPPARFAPPPPPNAAATPPPTPWQTQPPAASASPWQTPPPTQWQTPVTVASPARSSTSRTAALFALVAIIALGGIAVYLRGQAAAVPPGTSDFAAGQGKWYRPDDSSFTVQLPGDPEISTEPVTVGSVTVSVQMASVQTDDYEIGVASMALPAVVPKARIDEALGGAMDNGLASVDADGATKHRTTRAGLPAMDATFRAHDGYSAHLMVVLDSRYLYVLIVHSRSGTERLFHALDKSFIPTAVA